MNIGQPAAPATCNEHSAAGRAVAAVVVSDARQPGLEIHPPLPHHSLTSPVVAAAAFISSLFLSATLCLSGRVTSLSITN